MAMSLNEKPTSNNRSGKNQVQCTWKAALVSEFNYRKDVEIHWPRSRY